MFGRNEVFSLEVRDSSDDINDRRRAVYRICFHRRVHYRMIDNRNERSPKKILSNFGNLHFGEMSFGEEDAYH